MLSVKLNASDEDVINYLTSLWGSSSLKPNVTIYKSESSESNLETQLQTQSFIQTLIDNNIIRNSESVNQEPTVESVNQESVKLAFQQTVDTIKINDTVVQELVAQQSDEKVVQGPILNNDQVNDLPKDDSEIINNFPEIKINNKTEFKKQVKENLEKLREVGFKVYHNIGLEEEVNLVPKTVTSHDITKVYTFKSTDKLYRNNIMKDISRCTIFPKYKHGDTSKPENFRYLVNHHNTIKILDRLWCMELITKIKDNIPDQQIFKTSLIHRFNSSTSDTAIHNTQTTDSVVLLDIEKAFDSLEWDVLENLLTSNLTRKINEETAKQLVEQYMTILKNREFYYNNKPVPISKGISTGLPSSNLVFTLAIEEIIYRWFNKTKYENNKEFIMNVYVDDIFLNILELDKTCQIINSLIEFLAEFHLNINKNKSKAASNLPIDIPNKLKPTDFYLGIPFTRDVKLYGELVLDEFRNNKLDWDWEEIYDELCKDNLNEVVLENQRIIVGFMNYKLKPFLNKDSEDTSKTQIKKIIFNNWVKEIKDERNKLIVLIITILTILFAILMSVNM
jgi:hypothetical protein